MKKVSGYNRLTELKPEKGKRSGQLAYRIDPRTRYVNLPALMQPPLYSTTSPP